MLGLKIEGKHFKGLLDTGADCSIIRKEEWPAHWPLQSSSQLLQRLGYANTPEVSAKELVWVCKEGQTGRIQPFVLSLPVSLWGRDVLRQMKMRLTTDSSETSQHLMLDVGYVPGKGLGKNLQGITCPLEPEGNQGRKGLGFS